MNTEAATKLAEQLDGAKLVDYRPEIELVFAWFGGHGVNVYNARTGREEHYFNKMSADREEHMPGPWEYDPATIQRRHEVVVPRTQDIKGRLRKVADVNREADARLIAAAPELLKAASKIVSADWGAEYGPDAVRAFNDLAVAIAKARGEN